MFRVRKAVFPAALFVLILLMLSSPAAYAAACMEGIVLWAKSVLPVLFPFFVCTGILSAAGARMADRLSPVMSRVKLPAAAALCAVTSILSGYPVGSRCLLQLRQAGAISPKDATRVSVVCSTSGPMFLVGSVGAGMLGSAAAGGILLASHLIGVFLTAALFLPFLKKPQSASFPALNAKAGGFAENIRSGTISVLCVGGFIAFFCVVAQALEQTGIFALVSKAVALPLSLFSREEMAEGLTFSLLEATRGCAALSACGMSALPFLAFAVTFGGASILAQQIAFFKPAGVKIRVFLAVKLLQGIIAALVCALFTAF